MIGISPDSVESTALQSKHKLGMPLVSDESNALESYGVWAEKSMYGRSYMGVVRSTFLSTAMADRRIWRNVRVNGHASEVLAAARHSGFPFCLRNLAAAQHSSRRNIKIEGAHTMRSLILWMIGIPIPIIILIWLFT